MYAIYGQRLAKCFTPIETISQDHFLTTQTARQEAEHITTFLFSSNPYISVEPNLMYGAGDTFLQTHLPIKGSEESDTREYQANGESEPNTSQTITQIYTKEPAQGQ